MIVSTWTVSHMLSRSTGTSGAIELSKIGTLSAIRSAIVATASLAGLMPVPGDPIYALTKHAVIGFVRSVAPQLAERGITINAVCPGPVMTEMLEGTVPFVPNMLEAIKAKTPMRRIGKPEEIAGAVLWLCSDEAAFMTGREIALDGGQTI